jgi:prophage tail gpP-like protein
VITTVPTHVVSVIVGGEELRDLESYEISVGMTDIPGTFSIRMPFSIRAWHLCRPDREIRVMIDGVGILRGFIDDEEAPDESIAIAGRCRLGRVTTESAPSIAFSGLGLKELAQKLVSPWFDKVTLSNARNRNLVRGRGKKAKAGAEPLRINSRIGTRIEPGQTRWSALERLLEQAGYLAWSSGDGRELVVGLPNYKQEIQFRFFRPSKTSTRRDQSTVLSMTPKLSTGDRYSRVIVVGSGVGTDANFGAPVGARFGQARNDPSDPNGVGKDFTQPKRLLIQRSVNSAAEAEELAEREMARRDAQGDMIDVTCEAHGQRIAGAFTTLFAPDLLASVEDERTGTRGTYLIVSCNYRADRPGGETTQMKLVRKGAELSR